MKNNLIPIRIPASWNIVWNNLVEDGENDGQDLFYALYKDKSFFVDIGFYGEDFMAVYAQDWENNNDSILMDIRSKDLSEVIAAVEDWMINYYHQGK